MSAQQEKQKTLGDVFTTLLTALEENKADAQLTQDLLTQMQATLIKNQDKVGIEAIERFSRSASDYLVAVAPGGRWERDEEKITG